MNLRLPMIAAGAFLVATASQAQSSRNNLQPPRTNFATPAPKIKAPTAGIATRPTGLTGFANGGRAGIISDNSGGIRARNGLISDNGHIFRSR